MFGQKIEAYFDGVCEPYNPGGTAGCGAVIFQNGEKIWELSKIIDPAKVTQTSNNVAEYVAFVAILKELKKRGLNYEDIMVYGDSKLVIEQMFGDWNINKGAYVDWALLAQELLEDFPNIRGEWIPRDQNQIADQLSKQPLLNAGIVFRIQPQN